MLRFAAVAFIIGMFASFAVGEETKPLDPAKPEDAIAIVDFLTKDITLPRAQAIALTLALQTLAKVVDDARIKSKESERPAISE